ncbi:putative glycolipid-binding domain-containing protein [Paenibacillus sediminis]|uniref:Glycolipid-binding domain-containing protein n=1 Tax=Paenibacillus sediminis TaxID=664909 RepID=A0ABS4H324_9BACL|nr:putative glycolipid-binding domain-containing protein [Paenibacillus sediminis]MBP1936919.1 hypothetical protein [Paenibacillus sediminis]
MHHTIVWKRVNDLGLEYCNISFAQSTTIEGKVIGAEENDKFFVNYKVQCDEVGNTREVYVIFQSENNSGTLRILRDSDDQWVLNGIPMSDLAGIKDIDIGVTPSTNMLPIRRLNLDVGDSQIFTTAWVRFPQLTVQPLKQKYERISEDTYIYNSIESGYTARVKVDLNGIVVDYEGEWVWA